MALQSPGGALYPVLPLRDIVVFPHMIVPLFVGREKSVRALEDVMQDDKQILMLTQKTSTQDDPGPRRSCTRSAPSAPFCNLLKLPDGTVKVLVEGSHRAKVVRFTENPDFFQAFAEPIEEFTGDRGELDAIARAVIGQFDQYIKLNKKIPPEVLVSVNQIDDPAKLADTIAAHLALKISEKQCCSKPFRSTSGWKRFSAIWKAKSAFCRSKRKSAAASRSRWKRRSAIII